MCSDDVAAYAELIVYLVNVDRGRNLQIRGEPVHWDLMQEIAAAAYRRTTGRVAVTRPVTVMNKVVRGAWFEFSDGKVVDFGAERNADIIGRYLEMDAGAAYAGEIALVDAGSPVFRSGRVFYNILFDENAACHIALGGAYPGCIKGNDGLTDEELPSIGANVSFVHTDFVIGSDQIQAKVHTYDGREVAVLRDGRFVI